MNFGNNFLCETGSFENVKILFGSAFLSHFGGGERLLLELVKYAASKGHEVVFAGTSDYDGPGKSYKLPWTRSSIPPKELTEHFYNTLSGKTYKDFARIAERENPDRIFIQSEAQLFRFLPGTLRKKTYFWCQEPPRFVFEPRTLPLMGRSHFHLYSLMKPLLEPVWKSLNGACWIAGCSDYSAGRLKELFGLEAKTRYNWVDTDYFRPAQKVEKPIIPVIFCATRINPIKRQLLICQALNLVKDLEWEAVLAGSVADRRYYSEILSFCEKNGLSKRVKFPGPLGGSQLVEAYTKAAFTVYTAFYEPFGSVPVEGMACGTPAIGVNEGGVKEVIEDGKVGLLAEANTEGLAARIRTLLEDENLRGKMASKGRQFVIDRFEMKARCQDFLDDFEQTTRI